MLSSLVRTSAPVAPTPDERGVDANGLPSPRVEPPRFSGGTCTAVDEKSVESIRAPLERSADDGGDAESMAVNERLRGRRMKPMLPVFLLCLLPVPMAGVPSASSAGAAVVNRPFENANVFRSVLLV